MLKLKAKFSGFTKRLKTTELRFSINNEDIDELDISEAEKQFGWLFFSLSPLKKEVEDVMKKRDYGIKYRDKTPSQRLRGVLYQEWRESGTDLEEEDYYTQRMNALIKDIYLNLKPCS